MRSKYVWLPPHRGTTTTGTHQIGVSFSAHSALIRESAGRTVRDDIHAGTVFVTDREPIHWTDVAQPTEAVEIYLDRALLRSFRDRSPRVHAAEGAVDAVSFGLASVVKRAHLPAGGLTDIQASTLAHRLAEHLAETYYEGPPPPARVGRVRLGRRVMDHIAGYIRANLAGPVTLDQLAALATLSPYHFARAFKATTGMPPHRYVTATRLEAAKTALLHSPASVPEVAYSVGFSNLSHFRRLFRREMGVLPGELRGYRRDLSEHSKNGPSTPEGTGANIGA